VTCFEYRDTDIGPYNELAISVVLNEPHFLPNLPGRALLSGMMHRQMHAWVWHLPVTTEIARAGGVELYNYPKFIAGIEFEDGTTHRVCTLTEGDEHILTLRGERIRTPRSGRFQLFSHLFMDRQPQSSEFAFNALEMGLSMGPGDTFLELGDNHVIAEELRGVLVSRRPIQFQFLAGFEAILYGPEHLTLPLITRFSEEGGVRKLASAS